jgi:hypothetical protein
MECWWNERFLRKRRRTRNKRNLSQCHCLYHKSHTDYPRIELGSPRWQADD